MRCLPIPVIILGAGLHLVAQPSGKAPSQVFKADANLVLVPINVVDHRGAIVNGLRGDVFSIFEDKVSQRINFFSEQDLPASIGVVLDMSASMKFTLNEAKLAVREFLDAANSDDEAFLYSVSSRPNRNTDFTVQLDSLPSAVALSAARGSTALIDTIYCSLDRMRSAQRPRKAILVISDGMENHSRYSKPELMERALESDVQMYTITIYNAPAYEKPIQLAEERQGLTLLQDLAEQTGGLSFVARNVEDINAAAAAIGRAIRNEYTIGYVPQNLARDGKWHSLRVKLKLPGLQVYARSGYYAQ